MDYRKVKSRVFIAVGVPITTTCLIWLMKISGFIEDIISNEFCFVKYELKFKHELQGDNLMMEICLEQTQRGKLKIRN